MCSTEEDSALLHRSREAELVESGAEVESVVESVVRGEEKTSGCGGDDENEEASGGGVQEEAGESVEQAEGHSILPQVMIGMTLITWHGRKVIFSRN